MHRHPIIRNDDLNPRISQRVHIRIATNERDYREQPCSPFHYVAKARALLRDIIEALQMARPRRLT